MELFGLYPLRRLRSARKGPIQATLGPPGKGLKPIWKEGEKGSGGRISIVGLTWTGYVLKDPQLGGAFDSQSGESMHNYI